MSSNSEVPALRAKIRSGEAEDEDFGDSKARTTTKHERIFAATLRDGADFPDFVATRRSKIPDIRRSSLLELEKIGSRRGCLRIRGHALALTPSAFLRRFTPSPRLNQGEETEQVAQIQPPGPVQTPGRAALAIVVRPRKILRQKRGGLW